MSTRQAWTVSLTVADQATVSGTNFLTALVLARVASKEQYGAFVLAFSVMMLMNLFQNALVTKPLTVLGASSSPASFGRYVTALAVWQFVLGAGAGGAVMLGATWYALGGRANPFSEAVFVMGGALLFVQFQEFFRRVLFTRFEVAKVLRNDVVCCAVQLAGLLVLWSRDALSANTVFGLIAVSTGCGAVTGLLQCRGWLKGDFSGLRRIVAENWRFGRWVLGTNMAWYASTQLYLLIAGALLGLRGPAILEASRTIMAPTQILYFSAGNVLPSLGASRLHAGGPIALRCLVGVMSVAMMVVVGMYCLAVALAPERLLDVFYRGQYAGYGGVVQLYALMYFLMNSALIFNLGIDSLARPDRNFLIMLVTAAVALVVAFPLVHSWGVYGAALGMVLTQIVGLCGAWYLFRISVHERAGTMASQGCR